MAVLGREEGGKFSALRGERWLASGYLTAMTSRKRWVRLSPRPMSFARAQGTDRDISYMMKKLRVLPARGHNFKRWTLLSIGYFQLYRRPPDMDRWLQQSPG